MRVVIPGGSGHVGQSLRRHYESQGHTVDVLSRSGPGDWDGRTLGTWVSAIDGADVLINLIGKSVNCRYNEANLAEMLSSRVDSTRVLAEAIRRVERPPSLWINSSTATIYQHRFDAPNDDETGKLGTLNDPIPQKWIRSVEIALEWERTLFEAETPATRKVAIRSAMVMAPIRGSIFDVLVGLTRRGLMGAQAGGRQYVSWIHESDFCRAVDWIIDRPEITGTINLSSPNPLPQREFVRALREAVRTRVGLPAAAWMLEIGALLMRTETELLLKSRRVVPSRLLALGFKFEHPEWGEAARDLVARLKKL
jgi:hypothetical protein